jgi:DNA-binding HxlR family transcriptional regulator
MALADVQPGEQDPNRGSAFPTDPEQQANPACCPHYHRAVELIGRRWTGAILEILIQGGSLRFSQIGSAVTDLSDRMLSDRLKELEAYGLVRRTVHSGPPVRVEYALTHKGEELGPAIAELKRWARIWLVSGKGFEIGGSPGFTSKPPATAASPQSPQSS